MSLHVSEPQFHRLANRMHRTCTCDVVETETGAVVETTRHHPDAEQARLHAARIIERLNSEYPARLRNK